MTGTPGTAPRHAGVPAAAGPGRVPAPPGPGRWVRETAHQARPFTRHFLAVFCPAFARSLPAGLRRYGALLRHLDMRVVDGWLYTQPQFTAAGHRITRWLVPGFHRRAWAASRAVATRAWRREVEEWRGGLRAAFVRRNRALQRVDVTTLGGNELRGHLQDVRALLDDGDMVHMRHLVAQNIAVGDWASHVSRWTGIDPSRALAALRGASPASVRPLQGLDRLAATVGDSAAALAALDGSGPAAERLAALRDSSPALRAALDDYLDEHGDDLLGFDLDEPALRELPDVVLSALSAALRAGPSRHAERGSVATAAAADLRAQVPAAHRADYDALLEDARLLYGLRDDDVGLTEMRPYGLIRRGLLEAGRRLARRDALDRPEDVLETTPVEVDALLAGRGHPAAGEVAARVARRTERSANPPPLVLGDGPEAPGSGRLPPALARINDALAQGMSLDLLEVGPRRPPSDATIRGIAASDGTYEGRARIVRGPADLHRLAAGDVLVAPVTGPAFNVVLPLIGAIVTDRGGALSHAAVVAREFGVPAVVGTGSAVRTIPDGARVLVDGTCGVVTLR